MPDFSINQSVDSVKGYPIDFIGLKHVPSQMVRFQIPPLILCKDNIFVVFDRFSSIKCLSITENLVNAKLLVVGKLLADGKLFLLVNI